MPDEETNAQERLIDAFSSFERTLQDMLTAEARRSVDGAIQRLSATSGPFKLNGVDVEVVIRGMSVEAATPAERGSKRTAKSAARKPKARARAKRASSGRGRPQGALRGAILEAFKSPEDDLSTGELREHLQRRQMEASDDNLHQHLRRLVQAEELKRSGRGRYRLAAPSSG